MRSGMAMTGTTAISQLGCFSAVHRRLHLQRRLFPSPSLRFSNSKLSLAMSLERHGTEATGYDTKNTLGYAADVSKFQAEGKQNSDCMKEDCGAENIGSADAQQEGTSLQKKTAKIHDFCLGIPFGGFVLTGGIIGFLFSRSPATLSSGVLFGGALLFLSTFSLKVWRQGKSSLPFILGQAALSGALIWKNFQSYLMAKKIFPTGVNAIISSAMLCFYLYVLIFGGNPPPKKLKPSASIA